MTPATTPSPIDDYLRTVPEDRRVVLEDLRAKIRSVVPEAEECLSYGMPAFRLPVGVVAGFRNTRQGCSYYPFSGSVLSTVARFVRAFDQTQGALHFSSDKPLPLTLVRRLIQARRDELTEKRSQRQPSARRAKR